MQAHVITYRSGDLVYEVLPGESHSDAWTAVKTHVVPPPRPPDCVRRGHGSPPARHARRARHYAAVSARTACTTASIAAATGGERPTPTLKSAPSTA